MFRDDTLELLLTTPLELLASHKKLALAVGGLRHVLKPVSEAGIDATNLPYRYVSLPVREVDRIAVEIRERLVGSTGFDLNVLVVDSDKTFKPKNVEGLAIATRPSKVRGVVDLGALAYLLGRKLRRMFVEYPTPVAYSGVWVGLKLILRVSKHADAAQGYGAGTNLLEAVRNLGRADLTSVRWVDLMRTRQYPAVVVRVSTLATTSPA